jgi:hypothetical protein
LPPDPQRGQGGKATATNKKRLPMNIMIHKELINEIFVVTTKIQKEYPELYENLRETPLFIAENEKQISTADFEQYLESLKTQLADFRQASPASLTQI